MDKTIKEWRSQPADSVDPFVRKYRSALTVPFPLLHHAECPKKRRSSWGKSNLPSVFAVQELRMVFTFSSGLNKDQVFCDTWKVYEIQTSSSIKFCWNTAVFICLHIDCGCFCPVVAKLSSCDWDRMVCKAENISWPFVESLLSPCLCV